MNEITAGYGLLTLATCFLSAVPKRRDHTMIAGLILAANWSVTAVVVPYAPPGLIFWPLCDVFNVLAFAALFRMRPERWKLLILSALIMQSIAHMAFWGVGLLLGRVSPGRLYFYEAFVNILFVCQLGSAATPGGVRVVLWARHRLFSPRRLGGVVGGQRETGGAA